MLMNASGWRFVPGFNIGTAANTASSNKSIVRGLAYHNKVYKALRAHNKPILNLALNSTSSLGSVSFTLVQDGSVVRCVSLMQSWLISLLVAGLWLKQS